MLLSSSSLPAYALGIIIAIVVVQYAFAIFCLLKLAYFDVSKKEYVLWNLFILIVFFIGGATFLIYYYKHRDKRIEPLTADKTVTDAPNDGDKENYAKSDNSGDSVFALDGEAAADGNAAQTDGDEKAEK